MAGGSATRPGAQETAPPMTWRSFIRQMALQSSSRFTRLEDRTSSDQRRFLRSRTGFAKNFDLLVRAAARKSRRLDRAGWTCAFRQLLERSLGAIGACRRRFEHDKAVRSANFCSRKDE